MKICPKCDAQNANSAPVCKHCGANLNETAVIDEAVIVQEKPPYNLNLALLFALLSFVSLVIPVWFPVDDAEAFMGMDLSPYIPVDNLIIQIVFSCVALVFLVISAIFLRGIFKKKPAPGKGIFIFMILIVCGMLLFLNLISFI